MRKNFILVGFLISIGALAGGIYAFYRRQLYLATQFCYKIHQVKILAVERNLISLRITVKILNRSTFAVDVSGYSFKVSINNDLLSTVTASTDATINPEGVSYLTFDLNIDPVDIYDNWQITSLIQNLLVDQSKVKIKVDGYVSARLQFIFVKKMPILYEASLKELLTPADPKTEQEKLKCPKDF